MQPNNIFNATLCLISVLILSIHIVNIALKKNKRKDEISLLVFFIFTAVHFATYLSFALSKPYVSSRTYILAFYTVFYIMNNIEALLFFLYINTYIDLKHKTKKILMIITLSIFSLFIISDLVNLYNHVYFDSVLFNGVWIYQRSKMMIISQGYQFVTLSMVLVITIFNKKLQNTEKVGFCLYCILPLISIFLQNTFSGYAIAYLFLLLSIEILFLFINVERNIKLEAEEQKLKEANIKIMVSQIQPHFVYNTLSSISTLIPINPEQAQLALDNFSEYLRMNFSTLTSTKLVSFEDELKHIKTYLSLEQMRFKDRIKVVYDINVSDFLVPPLSIQPLVENAIKHGILKKIKGGTLFLKTYETNNAYVVVVKDDGVGFNSDEIDFNDNKHIGLNNVRHRIKTMCKGELILNSEINKGTEVTVKFYK